jgi:hypothetical protein
VPGQLTEDTFWQVYFSLILHKTDNTDWERDKEEPPHDEDEEKRSDREEVRITRWRLVSADKLTFESRNRKWTRRKRRKGNGLWVPRCNTAGRCC